METTTPPTPEPTTPDSDETRAFQKLIYFQFLVLTGIVVLALPGALALEGSPLSDFRPSFYIAALSMHLIFVWRLWTLEPRFRPHYVTALAVVLLVPWIGWAAKRFLDFDASVVGAGAFVVIIASALFTLARRPAP